MNANNRHSKRATALAKLGAAKYEENTLRERFESTTDTGTKKNESSSEDEADSSDIGSISSSKQPESPCPLSVSSLHDEGAYLQFSEMLDTFGKRKLVSVSTPQKAMDGSATLQDANNNNHYSPTKSPPKKISRSLRPMTGVSRLEFSSDGDLNPDASNQGIAPHKISNTSVNVTNVIQSHENDEFNVNSLSEKFNDSFHLHEEPFTSQSSGLTGSLAYLSAYNSDDSQFSTYSAQFSPSAGISTIRETQSADSMISNSELNISSLSDLLNDSLHLEPSASKPTGCLSYLSGYHSEDSQDPVAAFDNVTSIASTHQSETAVTVPHIQIFGEIESSEATNVLSAAGWIGGDAVILPLEDTETSHESHVNEDTDVHQEDSHPKPRSRNTEKWRKNKVKLLKDSGQAHVSLAGKEHKAKSLGRGCDDKCKRKCLHAVDKDTRDQIFRAFWDLKNHTLQWGYICQHVKPEPVKRRTVTILNNAPPKRNVTNLYFLPVNGIQTQVCKTMFLDTLKINAKWVYTALEKQKKNSGSIPCDMRGKAPKKLGAKQRVLEDVKKHILSFKTVEGHYTRKNSKARYLPERLNRKVMHSMYVVEKQAAKAARVASLGQYSEILTEVEKEARNKEIEKVKSEPIASLRNYRDIFKTEFNLKFFKPKKDQCAKCLSFKHKTQGEKTPEVIQKYEKHLSDKVIADDLKRQDIESIKKFPADTTTCVATYDLEKVLLCPKGENSEYYYKSKISIHNFSIFVSGSQKAYNFAWDETEGGKGATEISTNVWLFIKEKVQEGIKEFHFYSDNCSAQNKNQFLFSMYILASIRFGLKIIHRYLEVGHTHMEVDSVHATIEKSVKNVDIFVPSQWFMHIKAAKKTRPYYSLKTLSHSDFLDFRPVAAHQTWDQVRTSQIKEIIFDAAEPGTIKYKNEYLQDFITRNILRKAAGRPVNYKTLRLQNAYHSKIPLKPAKLKDLQDLCRSSAIPSAHHQYYMEYLPSLNVLVGPPEPPQLSDVSEMEDSGSEPDSSNEEGEVSEEEDYLP